MTDQWVLLIVVIAFLLVILLLVKNFSKKVEPNIAQAMVTPAKLSMKGVGLGKKGLPTMAIIFPIIFFNAFHHFIIMVSFVLFLQK